MKIAQVNVTKWAKVFKEGFVTAAQLGQPPKKQMIFLCESSATTWDKYVFML